MIMSGFRKKALNDVVRNNIFNQISKYIVLCCNTMSKELLYFGKKLPNDENKIRNYLLRNYLDKNSFRRENNMMMFRFEPEVPENYNQETLVDEGRVDIKIINQKDSFNDNAAAYFVECKRIDGEKQLNQRYVNNGIRRFVVSPPRYKSYYGKNFMLGFVVKLIDIEENVKEIELIQQSSNEIETINGFEKNDKGFLNVYDCKYFMNNEIIELRNIFADFSANID